MIKFIKKELDIEESLKQRIMIICDFWNTTPTNLTYSEHIELLLKIVYILLLIIQIKKNLNIKMMILNCSVKFL